MPARSSTPRWAPPRWARSWAPTASGCSSACPSGGTDALSRPVAVSVQRSAVSYGNEREPQRRADREWAPPPPIPLPARGERGVAAPSLRPAPSSSDPLRSHLGGTPLPALRTAPPGSPLYESVLCASAPLWLRFVP